MNGRKINYQSIIPCTPVFLFIDTDILYFVTTTTFYSTSECCGTKLNI